MSKEINDSLLEYSCILAILTYFTGFENAYNIMLQTLKQVNDIIYQVMHTSMLSLAFGYTITYFLVRMILTAIRAPRGKEGHFIGKILYFVVSWLVGIGLDRVSKIIF